MLSSSEIHASDPQELDPFEIVIDEADGELFRTIRWDEGFNFALIPGADVYLISCLATILLRGTCYRFKGSPMANPDARLRNVARGCRIVNGLSLVCTRRLKLPAARACDSA